jgi:hypothetical protein
VAMQRRAAVSRAIVIAGVVGAAVLLSACNPFSSKKTTASESVFSVKAELSDLSRTSCKVAHTQEAYATVGFTNADGTQASAYPGSSQLTTFAQGACAQRFTSYVGVDYLDSSLYFTYLLPSARSWEQNDDHNVICFVTTTGSPLTASVKGSKK